MPSWDLRPTPPAPTPPPMALKLSISHGKLLVSGPAYKLVRAMPGATLNDKLKRYELSLTLETLRGIRKLTNLTPPQFHAFCSEDVLAWARAAVQVEKQVRELHQRIDTGWRLPLPWFDRSGVESGRPRPAYDHQAVMASVACALEGVAFVCEMGTGKTRAAVESIRYKLESGALDLVLVVCPKGVMNTWRRELKNWSPNLEGVLLEGAVTKRRMRLQNFQVPTATQRALGIPYPVLVTNYDVLYLLQETLVSLGKRLRLGVVLDEMHRVRNPNTRVTKAAMQMSMNAMRWRLGMTGSPILQGAHDVWSQWFILDWGLTYGPNYVQFRREFFTESEYDYSIDPLDGTLDEIGTRMRKIGLRFRKADCLDLPPKLYEEQEIIMTPPQQKAYNDMRDTMLAWLQEGGPPPAWARDDDDLEQSEIEQSDGRTATAANKLAMILRLTTITSGHVKTADGELFRFDPNPKLMALEELVEENIRSQQIIVWARYRENIRAIREQLARFNPVVIQGGMTIAQRTAVEEAFQTGQSRLLIGNPAAGGEGLNLQAASLAIYFSLGYSLLHRLQSEDRCHRSGSEIHNRVTYIDLLAKDSIDYTVLSVVRDKKSVADAVVDLTQALQSSAAT